MAGIGFHRFHNVVHLKGNAFEHRAGDMAVGGAARDAEEAAAGVLIPIRRAHTGQRGHEIHAAVVGHGVGQRVDFVGIAYHARAVAQPLDGRTAHEYAALERIGGFAADLPGHGGKQVVLRLHGPVAGIHQQKAAGAVGVFQHALFNAHLAEQSGVLVARNTGNRNRPVGETRRSMAVHFAAGFHFRQHIARDIKQGQQLVIPLQRVDIKEHGAAGVAGVGHKRLPLREVPHQPGIHRAETQPARFGSRPRAGHVIQYPFHFGCGKISVQHQPGFGADGGFVFGADAVAIFGGAPVLPHNRAVYRLAGFPVPHNGGLALVGYAQRGDFVGTDARLRQHFSQYRHLRAPDFFGVVLHPTRLGEMLRIGFLRRGHHFARMIEYDSA